MYIAWNGKFQPCGFISWKNFKVRTARYRQPYKGPTRATVDVISLLLTFRVITQFDIRLHQYTACVYIAWNGKFQPCGFISWKNFKVRIVRDRQPHKGPIRATRDMISLIFTFRFITQFAICLHHYTAYVYSTEHGKLKPCGFFSWKNFIVRTARDRQPYKGPTSAIQDIISLIITF